MNGDNTSAQCILTAARAPSTCWNTFTAAFTGENFAARLVIGDLARVRGNDMPWTCPVCRQPIRRSDDDARRHKYEAVPRTGQLYRCHVCRVDLLFDPVPKKLIIVERDPGAPR